MEAENWKGVEAMGASFFMTIPLEIQEKIAKKLSDYKDVENLCEAFPHLYETLDEYFQAMKTDQVSKKVFDILLHKRYLGKEDALKCRTVSKTWKQSVDEHYRTANIHSVTFDVTQSYEYPRHVISVSASFSTRLNDYEKHEGNPFVGSRLLLICGGRDEVTPPSLTSVKSLIQSSKVAHVWQHVQHLEIFDDEDDYFAFWDTELEDEARQREDSLNRMLKFLCVFLEMMPNVRTVRYHLREVSIDEVLRALPNLALLEQLIVSTPCDEDVGEKEELLQVCQSSLKLLSWGWGISLDVNFERLVFNRLEEFCITGAGAFSTEEYSLERGLGTTFPAVKILGLGNFDGSRFMYYDFATTVNMIPSVKQAVISCNRGEGSHPDVQYDWFDPNVTYIRRGLDKIVIVNIYSYQKDLFDKFVQNFDTLLEDDDEECKIVAVDQRDDLSWRVKVL